MKKIITLALVLALALSLAVPALAFWGNAPSTATASGVTVDIYLVDHDGSGSLLAGLISLPATDRGYAKNEIVAAVASVMVPSNVNVGNTGTGALGYRFIDLSGTNVAVNAADNNITGTVPVLVNTFAVPTSFAAAPVQSYIAADNTLRIDITAYLARPGATTMRVLYFAKVTGDDASMSITLTKAPAWTADVLVLNDDYVVTRNGATHPAEFVIAENNAGAAGNALFRIRSTSGGRADSVEATADSAAAPNLWFGVIYNGGYQYALTENVGAAGVNLGRLPTAAEQLVLDSRMNTIFANALGMDITKRGYNIGMGDWESFAASLTNLTESVDIEPWTPYVTVPDNIVVDPPKTGDAVSILGFVMIALAGAAVVAVKKVRA